MSGPRGRRARRWRRLGVGLLLTFFAYGVLMFSLQRWFLFPMRNNMPDPAAADRPGVERLWIETPAGRVEGWLRPGAGVSAAQPGPAVIFAHGNAELIDHWLAQLEPYHRRGVTLLLPEYRGYGRSAGSPSQEAITADFVAFYELLAARPEVDGRRILFHGRSLGGGAVCALAAQRPPAALILQSTFTSVRAMARRFLMPGFLVSDPFDNLDVVSQLERPLLIAHGRKDELIPFAHAEQLRDAAPRAKLLADDAGHNDCPQDWNVLWGAIDRLLIDLGR